MNPFRFILKAFFQPDELNRYIVQKRSKLQTIIFLHIGIVLVISILYIILIFPFNNEIAQSLKNLTIFLLLLFITLGIVFIIAMICGAFCKRHPLTSYSIGIFWGIFIDCYLVVLIYIINYLASSDSGSYQTILNLMQAILIISIIAFLLSLITNIIGKTKGFIIILILSLIISLITTLVTSNNIVNDSLSGMLPNTTGYNQNKAFLLLKKKKINLDFDIDFDSLYSQHYSYSEVDLIYIDTDLNNVNSDKKISDIAPAIYFVDRENDKTYLTYYNNTIELPSFIYYKDVDFYFKIEYKEKKIQLRFVQEIFESKETIKYILYTIYITNSDSTYSFQSKTQKTNGLFPPLIINDNDLFLQTDLGIYIYDINENVLKYSKEYNFWYSKPNRLSKTTLPNYFLPLITKDSIITCSPSGYVFKISLSPETANDDMYKVIKKKDIFGPDKFVIFLIFFIIKTLLLFSIALAIILFGLYRIPFYLIEIIIYFIQLIITTLKKKIKFKDLTTSPLFYDHISTLPLPLSKQLIHLAAKKDPEICAQSLIYLIEETHHKKFGSIMFEEFHRNYHKLFFRNIYTIIRNNSYSLLNTLLFYLKENTHIGQIVKSYCSFLDIKPLKANQKKSEKKSPAEQIKKHVTILEHFHKAGYKDADCIFYMYDTLRRLHDIKSIGELLYIDKTIKDIVQMSVNNNLINSIADVYNYMIDFSNDLKNFDLLDTYRDKQYYISEARIKLFEIQKMTEEKVPAPEKDIIIKITKNWEEIIMQETKLLRAPAELEITLLNKEIRNPDDWNQIMVEIKNIGQSPAEDIRINLLENKVFDIKDNRNTIKLLGTGEKLQAVFSIFPKERLQKIRIYFDIMFTDFERKDKMKPFVDIISLSSKGNEFKNIPNPYRVGTPLMDTKLFFGRHEAIQFAFENLSAGEQNNVLIYYGQRRTGKTSILYRLKETDLKKRYYLILLDCQGFGESDTSRIFYKICNEIYKAVRDDIKLDKPALINFKTDPFITIDEYLDLLEESLKEKKIVLMFDEYEYLEYMVKDNYTSPKIFDKLRNIMQHRNKTMTFIFVGTHRLTELTEDYWSFLFNTALYFEIGALQKKDAEELITQPVKGFLQYEDIAIDRILRAAGNSPYFIQVTCRLLVNYCNNQKINYVTLNTVNLIFKEAVEGSTAHVKYLFCKLATEKEQEILTFLSRVTDYSKPYASASEISGYAQEYKFNYDEKYVREILICLKNKKLINEKGERGGNLYCFTIEFVQIWIKENIRLFSGYIQSI